MLTFSFTIYVNVRSRSVTGSNQPEPLSVLMPLAAPGENSKAKAKTDQN
ncbi:Os04g0489400 [Oryza sativa Japonica Group]|uniref:Os04g0489400 protein n=1 Tax=Oryza sativa subsp. japonica TaxID=39947 RepID=Q0JC66_ORYSJ|nr:Os04g0489400 [Oryza sativa Japonica Group]|eukprot:NP_001053157.2 Os04g0489400 [Oryza sativa Japonica Group]